MDLINQAYVSQYIDQLPSFGRDSLLSEMKLVAENAGYSVLRDGTAALITTLVSSLQPKRILEIGTSIGYSTVVLHRAAPQASIRTIEIDRRVSDMAHAYVKRAGYDQDVEFICGDAEEVLHYMEDSFDLIYMDGPKAQYLTYLSDCIRMMRPGAMMLCDDVLFYGMVPSDELLIKRQRTIVKRLREFIQEICMSKQLISSVIPIGNGLSVSIRRKDES